MLTLTPSGDITGSPGQTVGWGFSITNTTGFFLLVDSSNFCEPGQDPFTGPVFTCAPGLGASTYTDFIANNGTVIPPSGLIQPFNAVTMTGVGAYMIDPAALTGSIDTGSIVLSYQEYNGNPFAGGTQVSGDTELSAAASVTTAAAVPEPNSAALLAGALLMGLLIVRKRSRLRALPRSHPTG
jgi:hypothetical protein